MARFIIRIITLSTSFFVISSTRPPDDVTGLIWKLQNNYCGTQFCKPAPHSERPLCREGVLDANSDSKKIPNNDALQQRQKEPPCSECSCSESCILFGNCCADKDVLAKYYVDCYEIAQQVPMGYKTMYSYVVTKCLPHGPYYSEDLADKCERGQLGYIEDGRLVTFTHPHFDTRVTFRNKYCAICYNITNYTPWDVYISCNKDFDSSGYRDMNSLIRAVDNSSDCLITTNHKDATATSLCYRYYGMISSCNVTGSWQEYNETIEKGCQSYLNPALTYRNIFCAMCNGVSEEELKCPYGYVSEPSIIPTIMPFSAILNFDKSDVEVIKGGDRVYAVARVGKQNGYQCRDGDVFDTVSRICREKYCPLVKHPRYNTCVELIPTKDHVVTTWKLTVYYNTDIIIPYGVFSDSVGFTAADSLKRVLIDYGFAQADIFPKDYASIYSSDKLIIKESQIKLRLLLLPNSSLELSRQRLETITNFTMNITWHDKSIELQVVPDMNPRNITDMLLMGNILLTHASTPFRGLDFNKIIDVPLGFNVSCPMIRFKSDDIIYVNNSVVIHGDTVLGDQEYFVKGTDNYYVCFDSIYKTKTEPVISKSRNSSVEFQIEQVVTIICFSCSLVCLMMTMVVYILIRQLHTVPGLNLILLTFSLFVAQSLYFFGAGAGTVTTPTICTVIGVLIHYFWLVSFAWMNICCLHMFKVFTNLFNSLKFAENKRCLFLKYSVFAFGLPLLIVGITMLISYITSNATTFGYGGSSLCFVASGLVSTLSFGVPAGLTVITNTVLLMYTVVSVRQAKNGQSSKGKPGTSDVVKFFKLSTLTGLSWLFGFLGYFTNRVELLYIFTVFTAGQGVFIFLSFVVSKRILKLFRESIACTRGKEISRQGACDNTANQGQTTSETLASTL